MLFGLEWSLRARGPACKISIGYWRLVFFLAANDNAIRRRSIAKACSQRHRPSRPSGDEQDGEYHSSYRSFPHVVVIRPSQHARKEKKK